MTLVAAGANLPFLDHPPADTLRLAVKELVGEGFGAGPCSRLFVTPCFPAGAGPDYINAAFRLTWRGTAAEALAALHRVEARLGRERALRWGPRTLDLDLLALEDVVLPDGAGWAHWAGLSAERQTRETPDRLILPHPRMQDRAFVLVPLADVAPDWRHPVTGRSVAQMIAALPAIDRAAVVAL